MLLNIKLDDLKITVLYIIIIIITSTNNRTLRKIIQLAEASFFSEKTFQTFLLAKSLARQTDERYFDQLLLFHCKFLCFTK